MLYCTEILVVHCNMQFLREAEDMLSSQLEKIERDAKKLDFRERVLQITDRPLFTFFVYLYL